VLARAIPKVGPLPLDALQVVVAHAEDAARSEELLVRPDAVRLEVVEAVADEVQVFGFPGEAGDLDLLPAR